MQQIVYTRCKPRRELLNVTTGCMGDGKVVNEEGFAIHNFSEGILTQSMVDDPLFLENIVKKKNAAKEMGSNATGIFYSYEYFFNTKGGSILGQEYLRPYNAADVRPNGQKHRPGNYIKQYIVGEFDNYPCLLFGADCWDAAAQAENAYYHDKGEPLEFLPELNIKYGAGSISQERIRNFISNGRVECVKKLISAVISEMSKPMNNRKFIVVKDLPENVEMWVAAVELAMPVYLAKQISFSTNVVATANLSVDNTFYSDVEDKFIKASEKAAREAGGKKDYYSMIIGIHPAAQGSSGITFGMNNAAFWLLDGQTNTIENADAFDTNLAYFDAAVLMNEDISDFNSLLAELEHVKFGNQVNDLYELFDGYKYLLDSASNLEKGEYPKIKRFLSVFKKYESAPYKWSRYLAEKVYRVYNRFLKEDEKGDMALLKQIVSMDHGNKLKGDIEAYLLEKYLFEIKARNIDAVRVRKLKQAYSAVYPSMKMILEDGFKENIPVLMDYAGNWNSDQSYFIFCNLYDYFNSAGTASIDWHKDEMNAEFIEILFGNICRDINKSADMLAYVKNSPVYLDLAVRGANADYDMWAKIICSTVADAKIELICGTLMEIEGISMQQYEKFLIGLLEANKERDILFKYLIKAAEKFGVTDDCSCGFIEEYLRKFESNAGELRYLVSIIAENDVGSASEEMVYSAIETFLSTATVDNAVRSLAKEFEKWRNGLKKPAGRAYHIVFSSELMSADAETVSDLLERYIAKDPIITDVNDMQMIVAAAEDKVQDDEVLVKLYHIIGSNDFPVRRILLSVDFEKPEGIIRYIKLLNGIKSEYRRNGFEEDIAAIGEDLYAELKGANIDKIEKFVLKTADKEDYSGDLYKEYFKGVRERIQEEKAQEKLREKESRKEAKESKQEEKVREKSKAKERKNKVVDLFLGRLGKK